MSAGSGLMNPPISLLIGDVNFDSFYPTLFVKPNGIPPSHSSFLFYFSLLQPCFLFFIFLLYLHIVLSVLIATPSLSSLLSTF